MHATSSTYWGVCDSNYLHHLVQWHTVQPGNTNTDTQCIHQHSNTQCIHQHSNTQCIHQHSNTQCMPHHQHIDAYETVTTCTTWYSDTQLNQATPTLTHNVYTNTLTHNACHTINILMRMRQLLLALPDTVTHSSTRQHHTLTHNVHTNTLTHNVYTNTLTHNVYTNTLTHNACLIINILMHMRQLQPALPVSLHTAQPGNTNTLTCLSLTHNVYTNILSLTHNVYTNILSLTHNTSTF